MIAFESELRALLARGKVPYTAVTEIVTAILHAEFTTLDELLDSVVICKEFARLVNFINRRY